MKNLIICSARYSDNLGDGVIADCAEFLIRQFSGDATIKHFDLAGRTDWDRLRTEVSAAKPPLLKSIFYRIPAKAKPLATQMAWRMFMRARLEQAWEAMDPEEGSGLVFGGGQLWNDVGLNFPLKISFVHQKVADLGGRIAIGPVGVSKNWSPAAKNLLSKVTTEATSVWVRDVQSAETLAGYTGVRANVTFDSAICAADCYGIVGRPRNSGPGAIVGVGVANPEELATQAEDPSNFEAKKAVQFWIDFISELRAQGFTPVLFTNGAQEDEAFASSLHSLLPDVARVSPPKVPADLVNTINSFDALVSYRLHANIIAYSCGVPSVGLVWDPKVRGFASAVGRQEFCLTPPIRVPVLIASLEKAMRVGVDDESKLLNKSSCTAAFQEIVASVIL